MSNAFNKMLAFSICALLCDDMYYFQYRMSFVYGYIIIPSNILSRIHVIGLHQCLAHEHVWMLNTVTFGIEGPYAIVYL